jgi:antitoxin component YwqK of YwqJK toxin-antitoxin module
MNKVILTIFSVLMLAGVSYAAKMYAPSEYTVQGGIYKTLDGQLLNGTIMRQETMHGSLVIVQVDVEDGEVDLNGEMRIYWGTGELMAQSRTKAGKLHGTAYEYYQNGKVKVKESYSNGLYDGKRTVYYENGEINSEMDYDDDVLDGKVRIYNIEGKLQLEGSFDDGVVKSGSCVINGKKIALTNAELANWNNTQRLPACGN